MSQRAVFYAVFLALAGLSLYAFVALRPHSSSPESSSTVPSWSAPSPSTTSPSVSSSSSSPASSSTSAAPVVPLQLGSASLAEAWPPALVVSGSTEPGVGVSASLHVSAGDSAFSAAETSASEDGLFSLVVPFADTPLGGRAVLRLEDARGAVLLREVVNDFPTVLASSLPAIVDALTFTLSGVGVPGSDLRFSSEALEMPVFMKVGSDGRFAQQVSLHGVSPGERVVFRVFAVAPGGPRVQSFEFSVTYQP